MTPTPISNNTDFSSLTLRSPSAEKIACFRALFRGRTDCYPYRFESRKTGRAGYSPACGNEWERGLCAKPRIKCSDCPNQNWLPAQDWTVRWHLSGQDADRKPFVMGLYPMLLDETCCLLAIDLDGPEWMKDASALQAILQKKDLPIALERSRSGNGGHFWFFFEEAVPAILARKLGTLLLSEAMDRRAEVGMASYDRLFPNQDTLPKGGFGNLIALPLQKAAREQGNSVFIDSAFQAFPDQWAFLGNLPRISKQCLRHHIEAAGQAGQILPVRIVPTEEDAHAPWRLRPPLDTPSGPVSGSLPEALSITISDQIYIPKAELSPMLRNRIVRLAAFQNPEFYRAQAMRLPTYDKPRIIACAEDHAEHIALPRGCMDELKALFRKNKIRCIRKDRRQKGRPLDLKFIGTLRPEQKTAAEAMLRHDIGTLAATTAFGKTVLAAWLIAQRKVNTLVLVHRQQLMEQWVERLAAFLGISEKSIGRLGAGRRKLKGQIDIALMQSVVRKGQADERLADYGHLIIDECHHLPARNFELAASRAKAKYVMGLSATIQRKDGHHPIIFMQCGPIRHRVDAKSQARARPFSHSVIVRPTPFQPQPSLETCEDARIQFQQITQALVEDSKRNRMICHEVIQNVRAGRCPLVLTERTEHIERLKNLFEAAGQRTICLKGGMNKGQLTQAISSLHSESPRASTPVILATGRFVGEGFDCPQLDTLFVTLPISWQGTIAQYAGRLHRLHDGKTEVRIYDYVDLEVPMLARMFDKRCRGYEDLGYSIQMPASALPGWPQAVPLPVDPAWKHEYSGSVKRLIRDGIETPLAELFLRTTQTVIGPQTIARSAAEAFLYQRLESLPETHGNYKLNHHLPIPFNQQGTMEVDFLNQALCLVIELDGSQHLNDEAAWRSDRQKDALLQRNGYFILRFLASDLAKNIDAVLDSIYATQCFLERGAAHRLQ